MQICPYDKRDTAVLNDLYHTLHPQETVTGQFWQDLLAEDGRIWVMISDGGTPVGYASVIPIPGLPGLVELDGGIAPDQRRQGWGSQLLHRVLNDLRGTDIRRVSYCVPSLDMPTALFLVRHGFEIEHEEWVLRRPDLLALPPVGLRPLTQFTTSPSDHEAARQFCQLYETSFGGRPWYQPFSLTEALAALHDPTDILFLVHDNIPIGFAWLEVDETDMGIIEPMGIMRGYQGQGYGRYLLIGALHRLAQRGAAQAQLGLWRSNESALHLYQSLAFQHHRTLIYLAVDVKHEM